MSKITKAFIEGQFAVADYVNNLIPDPNIKFYFSSTVLALRIPYVVCRELIPEETDEFVNKVLESGKLKQGLVDSSEFKQALGKTLENLTYAKDLERRDIIKKAFTGAFISQDEYAKDNLERLQEAAQLLSLPALQHLSFLKRDILPIRDEDITSKTQKSKLPGFTDFEYKSYVRRTSFINTYYNLWFDNQKKNETQADVNLLEAREQKSRAKFVEFWSEYVSRNIFRQGNDPTIGTFGGGSGTVQYLTEFGEKLIDYADTLSKE